MLLLFFVFFFIYSGIIKDSNPQYFVQKLNHFNPLDSRTFKQKFFVEDSYFDEENGPVILYISGEAPCQGIEEWGVEMYAKPLNALFLTLEHRYYGDSNPFVNEKELSVENLQFLSSRQALEDLANFRVSYEKNHLKKQHPWIIIGGSYSGALSAWSRYKYPHLYNGALSSSGVVNTIFEFYEFDEQVQESVGSECLSHLKNGTEIIEKLIYDDSTRNATLLKFDSSAPLLENRDFLMMLADVGAETTQYGYQKYLCNCFLHDHPDDVVAGYVQAYQDVFVKNHLGNAAEYNIAQLLEKDNNGARMWWFQKCSEMAYFQTAPIGGSFSLRSSRINLEYHKDRCERAFGISNTHDLVDNTLWHYGAIDVFKHTTNIYFTNGSQDPWKRATIAGTTTTSKNNEQDDEYKELKCENCGHCVDLYDCPDTCTEEKEVQEVREEILNHMKKWIQ